jgi:hypothetical protein
MISSCREGFGQREAPREARRPPLTAAGPHAQIPPGCWFRVVLTDYRIAASCFEASSTHPKFSSTHPKFTASSASVHRWCYGDVRTVLDEGGERCTPNQTALCTMSFVDRALTRFFEDIGEGKRWTGRTQSSESWSGEQLRQEPRMQGIAGSIEDRARVGSVPVSPEVWTYGRSIVVKASSEKPLVNERNRG